jgi:DNA (cytosine-5)-methyltransferase 1
MVNQQSLNELSLFAGAGGGVLGGKLLGWNTVCAVEWEPYPASILCARQNDGFLPPFPIWDDVQTFDGHPWRGLVDVVSGGFPCQDISAAGKGAGIEGERSSMWKHMARIIGEIQPTYVFAENSPMLRTRGLGVVLQDLAKMGYDAQWGVLSAAEVGANHKRERMWIVAKNTKQHRLFSHAEHNRIGWGEQQSQSIEKEDGTLADTRCKLWSKGESAELDTYTEIGASSSVHNQSSSERQFISDSYLSQQQGGSVSFGIQQENAFACNPCWWEVEPNVGRVANGVASGVDRLKAIGNGQVPLCAATAWTLLNERLEQELK